MYPALDSHSLAAVNPMNDNLQNDVASLSLAAILLFWQEGVWSLIRYYQALPSTTLYVIV
ncbi:MAG TPA: hypothetical protein VGO47_09175 [Chlamydiales bacterium]|nr:hypothetical protein [Chlamydiales bacterium]